MKMGRIYVAIYSVLANRLAKSLFESRAFPGFKSWRLLRTEPYLVGRVPSEGNERETRHRVRSRFDFELARGEDRMLVEVQELARQRDLLR